VHQGRSDEADEQASALAAEYLLDPDVAFLNHGSFGAIPRPVFEHWQRLQRDCERNPVEALARALGPALDDARGRLGAALGAGAGELAFTENATTALNLIARSVVPSAARDGGEVLVTALEYGAQQLAWRWLCDHHGVAYREARVGVPAGGPDETARELLDQVSSRTRVVLISHITSDTALRLPVERVCEQLSQRGIVTVIDGAHAPGQIELRLDGAPWDYYVGNLHKWFAAPRGAAFLYATHDRQAALDPLVISWGGTDRRATLAARTQWSGTRDPSAWLAVPHALDFHARRLRPLAPAARALLAEVAAELERLGLTPASTQPDQDLLMASFLLPDRAMACRLEAQFAADRIEALVKRDDVPVLRVCVAWYVTAGVTRRLLDAVAYVARAR
jgi:isopenicillin-N epimerase